MKVVSSHPIVPPAAVGQVAKMLFNAAACASHCAADAAYSTIGELGVQPTLPESAQHRIDPASASSDWHTTRFGSCVFPVDGMV